MSVGLLLVAAVFGSVLPVTALVVSVLWFTELWADHVSGRIPMATVTKVRLTRRCMFFEPAASLVELGLNPCRIRESARDAVA